MLGLDVAMIRDHIPAAVGPGFKVRDAGMPDDFRAADLSRFRVGMGHAVGIDMTFDGVVHRALEMFLVQQRKQLRRLVD